VHARADLQPSARTASRIAHAHLIARAGPSNVANTPSPVDLTSRPSKGLSSARDNCVVGREQPAP
jgi:hypothetical protein